MFFTLALLAFLATDFNALVDRYFDMWFHYHPAEGTEAGFHQYDAQLNGLSQSSIKAEVAALAQFLPEFEHAPQSPDRDLVIAHIRAGLLNLEEIRMWEKNPDRYPSSATEAIFTIMSRKYAPAAERLKSVIAREHAIPALLAAARANLKNPPGIYTQIALEQLPGMVHFFQNDVPAAFQEARDPRLRAEFQQANQAAIAALGEYQKFLKNDLLPRSRGDFRIGAVIYRNKILYEEMVDTPLDQLLRAGYQDLRRNQQAFRETAARIDRGRTPQQILHDVERDHPAPDHLLQSFRDVLGGLRRFVTEHHIVTIPSPVEPIVEETPPFMRALTSASMDTPGPFEKVAKEAYLNVTLPEPGWSRQQVEEHMESFNRGVILSTAIHEAYPGHYVQFLWLARAPSKVRKLIGAASNAEGWAHYCEQMMIDEGYGQGNLKMRLGQLQDALLRDARYIVGISMHTGKMSYAEGIEFFVNEGYQTRANAERETKRGTADPTYLVYTLGKLEILRLREDYRKLRGASFTLQDFHDRFLEQGAPPIAIVRRALLKPAGT
jgi:Bacterial protein of unknown function (DUF885)